MRISHKHRLVFLATPRTGSTTTRNILDSYSDIKSVHITKISEEFPFYHHISASELELIFKKRMWKWSDYKKFCVVRNPYDRVVSLYHHHQTMMPNGSAQKGIYRLFAKMKEIVKPPMTFKDYVMQIDPVNRLTAPLKTFICDSSGNFLVEDVLMFEKLTEQLPAYLDRLGIHIISADIPHLNLSKKRKGYRDYYDDKTRKRVEKLYAYEIDRFGYSF